VSTPSARRSRRRRLPALTAVVVLTTLLVAPGAAAAQPACPTEGIPFTSQLTNGTVQIGRLDPATGATATACGVVDFTPELNLLATIPKENLSFAQISVPIALFGLLSVPVRITPVTDFTGPVTFAPDGIHIALSGQVVADVQVLLNTCRLGPFRAALTTDISGALTGRPFVGPDPASLAGELVGNEDAVPAARPTFLRCPLPVAALLNAITGLPSPPGESAITFSATLRLSPTALAALRR
jgi:hypothetical protein